MGYRKVLSYYDSTKQCLPWVWHGNGDGRVQGVQIMYLKHLTQCKALLGRLPVVAATSRATFCRSCTAAIHDSVRCDGSQSFGWIQPRDPISPRYSAHIIYACLFMVTLLWDGVEGLHRFEPLCVYMGNCRLNSYLYFSRRKRAVTKLSITIYRR